MRKKTTDDEAYQMVENFIQRDPEETIEISYYRSGQRKQPETERHSLLSGQANQFRNPVAEQMSPNMKEPDSP